MSDVTGREQPWYYALNRTQWKTLIASNLGWLFDGYESYAMIISLGAAFRQLLDPAQHQNIPVYVGAAIGVSLLGWAIGGLVGGIIADYVGRKQAMLWSIIAYSIMTGVSAFSWNWSSFLIFRIIVGLCIGSEWVTGASIVAELWPDKHRGKGVGLMQCGFGIGLFLAAVAWFLINPLGPSAWRVMFLLGVAPALLTLWIRRSIPESDKWERMNEKRVVVAAREKSGEALSAAERALARFTIAGLFVDSRIRRLVILASLMSLATTFVFWGVGTWLPAYVATVAAKAGLPGGRFATYAALANNGAAIIGYAAYGFLSDAYGRKLVTIAYMLLAFISIPIVFFWTSDLSMMLAAAAFSGAFVSGQYTWMAAWLPELFPTRVRATAMAFVFNVPRLIAWTGPLISGWIISNLGGFSAAAVVIASIYVLGLAALFLPETRGKPLPD